MAKQSLTEGEVPTFLQQVRQSFGDDAERWVKEVLARPDCPAGMTALEILTLALTERRHALLNRAAETHVMRCAR